MHSCGVSFAVPAGTYAAYVSVSVDLCTVGHTWGDIASSSLGALRIRLLTYNVCRLNFSRVGCVHVASATTALPRTQQVGE